MSPTTLMKKKGRGGRLMVQFLLNSAELYLTLLTARQGLTQLLNKHKC